MPRENSGQFRREATGRHSVPLQEIESMDAFAASFVQASPGKDPLWWRAVERFGVSFFWALVLAFALFKQAEWHRQDMKTTQGHYETQLKLVLQSHADDRQVLRNALERSNTLHEQLPQKLAEVLKDRRR